jgi:hypothetical protein
MLQHTLRDLRDKVDVMHFDALAKKYRMSRAFNEKDQSFGARFLVHLEKTKQEPEYDAALIDEAQDFDPSWFQCALRLCATRTMTNNECYSTSRLRGRKISLLPYRRNAEIYFYSY